MKDKVWNLFRVTGDIKYYILYKEMERLSYNAENKSQGDSN